MKTMEQHEAPAAERLIDHAWMVDCALLLHDRTGAAVAAERLFDELVLHDRAFERTGSTWIRTPPKSWPPRRWRRELVSGS